MGWEGGSVLSELDGGEPGSRSPSVPSGADGATGGESGSLKASAKKLCDLD